MQDMKKTPAHTCSRKSGVKIKPEEVGAAAGFFLAPKLTKASCRQMPFVLKLFKHM